MGWCTILLVYNRVHVYSSFFSQCRNELGPHKRNVTVIIHCYPITTFIFQEIRPENSISTDGTPHSHFLLAKRLMGMLMWMSLRAITHVLLVDVPTQVITSFITKKYQINKPGFFSIFWLISWQKARRSALLSSVCLCKISILKGKSFRSSRKILRLQTIQKCRLLVKDDMLIFWEIPQAVHANSERCWVFSLKKVDHCDL